ncbi:hypothetical protein HY572_06780 [Candidatus Micrarchaeota archaeon]|nr:hypothetical protein [Candidatus Micrarchaeota archaeon]
MHLAVYAGKEPGTLTAHIRPLQKVRALEREVSKSRGELKLGNELNKVNITAAKKNEEATRVLHWILQLVENHFATQGPNAEIGVFYGGLDSHESELITSMIRNAKSAAQLEEQLKRETTKPTGKAQGGFRLIK